MTLSAAALYTPQTATEIFEIGIEVARVAGLDVDSWRAGDPTRTSYKFVAQMLASADDTRAEWAKASWLSLAEGDWLTVLAWELYGVERQAATFATSTITLTNAGGGYYEVDAGDLRVRDPVSGATFRSAAAFTLGPSSSVDVEVEADVEGSDGNVGANDITDLVSPTLDGVTVTASTAATARDEQSDASLRTQCTGSLGGLSPNGPADALEYVARNSELTGTTEVTRARATEDEVNGRSTVYLAGSSGAVTSGAVTAVQSALMRWAAPLCFRPTAASATPRTVPVTYTVEGDPPVGWEDTADAAITNYFATIDIGGDASRPPAVVAESQIVRAVHNALPGVLSRVRLTGWTDIELAEGEVAVPGTLTGSEV